MKIIIILGNKLSQDGKMSRKLINRLTHGIQLYNPGDIIIVSGGNVANTKHTEAYYMKQYIELNSNICSKDIIKEPKSRNTVENIKYSLNIVNKLDLINIPIQFVTDKNHMIKVKKILDL